MCKLAAVLFLIGTMAHGCFGTEISENFIGVTSQVAGDGSGIFNVSGKSWISGSLTFNPADFTPTPQAPTGSAYLQVFTGQPGAVQMMVRDAGGSATVNAQNSFLELSSLSDIPWALVAGSGTLSFSLIVQTPHPIAFPPGSSPFDLTQLSDAGISVLMSDPSSSLGFNLTSVTLAPEPTGIPLLGTAFWLLFAAYKDGRRARLFLGGAARIGLRIRNKIPSVY